MNKITAWVGECPYCSWETVQRSQAAINESMRLHLATVHRDKKQ